MRKDKHTDKRTDEQTKYADKPTDKHIIKHMDKPFINTICYIVIFLILENIQNIIYLLFTFFTLT